MKQVGVCEQVCATLANLALKQPDHATMMAEAGAIPLIVQAVRTHLAAPRGAALCMRQASLAIRNMVVRNPDNRQPFLDEGIEELLREVHKFKQCDDEAYAALRDLQCEVASLNRTTPRRMHTRMQQIS